mmetsp:Transcript_9476/g.27216  ORF Transcript_9476/g.27216 Transcript_9476/m.27216 type:complete len:210 (-) Transcript_9476:79-708(-)
MWKSTATLLLMWSHGGAPLIIWMTVQATLQTSAFLPWPTCRITSGAMNWGVPTRLLRGLEPPPAMLPMCLEELKSASLITPSSVTRMLPPLMSQWTMSRVCRKSRPARICRVYLRARDSSKAPKLASSDAMDPPDTYSRKMLRRPSVHSVPRYRTMWRCSSWPMRSISRRSVATAAAARLSSGPSVGSSTCLTAMRPPVSVLMAWYTSA